MTYKEMKCTPAERSRRIEVCNRLNVLWNKRQRTDDKAKRKRIDRNISRIRATESGWLREAAYFMY